MPRLREDLLVSVPPDPGLKASVIVPVRDEQDLLPAALLSLAEQKTARGTPLSPSTYEVIVLINNTSDRSRSVAEHFQRLYPEMRLHVVERQLPECRAHVGYVRRILMDAACRRLQRVGSIGAILSTDADSQVAPNWIVANLDEFSQGADVVGGRIFIGPDDRASLGCDADLLWRVSELYRRLVSWIEFRLDPELHDPWPRHHHHYGASLAIKPDVYERVGKLPPRRHFEDLAFYSALIKQDFRIRHSMKVRVRTSARLHGRAGFGWAKTLSEWQQSGRSALRTRVESKAFLEFLFTTRRCLRRLWNSKEEHVCFETATLREVCGRLQKKPIHLLQLLEKSRHFGELLEETHFYRTCRDMWPEWERLAPMHKAVDELFSAFKLTEGRQFRTDAVLVKSST